MASPVESVVMDQVVWVRPLCPASRGLVELVGKHADGEGDGDVLGVEKVRLVLQIESSRGDPGVGQPVEGDVVQDVVSSEITVAVAVENLSDKSWLAGAVTVVDRERREIDRGVGQSVQGLRASRHDLG